MKEVTAVILAAGKGTRMKSNLPKVLHRVCGKPMLEHVIEAVEELRPRRTIAVIGHGAELVEETVGRRLLYAIQEQQLGTGHAVMQAMPLLPDEGTLLLVCGDTPLLEGETLKKLTEYHQQEAGVITVLTATLDEPFGYGRIIRNKRGDIERIVEEKDASPEEKRVKEVNSGVYCFEIPFLREALQKITPKNAQGEYYLTDVIGIAMEQGKKIAGLEVEDYREVQGINDRSQLALAERIMRERVIQRLMDQGVTFIDSRLTFVDKGVKIGKDTVIYPNVYIEGKTQIGEECLIRANVRITDCEIGRDVTIENSVVVKSRIGDGVAIGPFAYIRPETEIGKNVKVGDFVEIKKSHIGDYSKIPHLAYIGDAQIGSKVNIGAGTITCNYDGYQKHRTIIEDEAFIGSNSSLIAPVKIGKGAAVGAGSAITKDVPQGGLGITRSTQRNIPDFAVRKKQRMESSRREK